MLTVLEVVKRSAEFLEKKGVESARLNAELMIGHALGVNRMGLYLQFDRPLSEENLEKMRGYVARRAKREPLQYILGQTGFHDLTLKTDPRALIPRPETEQLVELIKTALPEIDQELRFLDLGTGSGAIALAIAMAYPKAEVIAVDRSPEAMELARENALLCGMQTRVDFRESDWFAAVGEEAAFDVIVSNPPYLTPEDMLSAEPEVAQFEPREALVGGEDGLRDLERIIRGSAGRLKPGGYLWLETGLEQRERLLALCSEAGYAESAGLDDWSGRERFIRARR